MKVIKNCFNNIVAPENIWLAWRLYRRGKRSNAAVREFEQHLEENLLQIVLDLRTGAYVHGRYFKFIVHDPKKRLISVPTVRDHVVHQAVMNVLAPFWETVFSCFSFSCRKNKGTHRARALFGHYLRAQSCQFPRPVWILHGDIQKCFDSINHDILIDLLGRRVACERTLGLLKKIVESYVCEPRAEDVGIVARGIPLGNLTSQLFVNIHLDPLDKFVKEALRVKRYIRYADDFLLVGDSADWCKKMSETIRRFLCIRLDLRFPFSHEHIRELKQGIETLGYRFNSGGATVRPRTKKYAIALWHGHQDEFETETISATALNSCWQALRGIVRCEY